MATPSIQDVLAAVPAVAELVDGMTELTPGVPASEHNLQTLWTYMNRVVYREIASDGMLVVLQLSSKRKGVYQDLRVQVQGKHEDCRHGDRTYQLRPHICEETHKNTGEGLLQCLLFARQSLKRYRAEGACPDCRSTGRHPVRVLKAAGMPRCENCMLMAVITSEASCKRARSSREYRV